MTHIRMHEDELDIDDALVRGLLRAQQPQWADLPLHRVVSSGTDNAMFRLGDDMVVRLPRIERAVSALTHEQRWLPVLASHLPLAVPIPLATGDAGDGYPWRWAVYSWIEGDNAFEGRIDDVDDAARDLAGFITALHAHRHGGRPTFGSGTPRCSTAVPRSSRRGKPSMLRAASWTARP